jgi:uncharacterized protein (TIGR03086 family)
MENQSSTLTEQDPRPLFMSAGRVATAIISWVTPDQLDQRTPCDQFDVATLLDHLCLVAPRIASLGRGTPDYTRDEAGTTGWPLRDIVVAWSAGLADAGQAWSDPASLTRTLELPWATMPGSAVLTMYLSEVIVHTWDLARATGQPVEFDPEAVELSLAFMHDALPAEIRSGETPFGPVVAVPDGADALDRLIGWTGRDPNWS